MKKSSLFTLISITLILFGCNKYVVNEENISDDAKILSDRLLLTTDKYSEAALLINPYPQKRLDKANIIFDKINLTYNSIDKRLFTKRNCFIHQDEFSKNVRELRKLLTEYNHEYEYDILAQLLECSYNAFLMLKIDFITPRSLVRYKEKYKREFVNIMSFHIEMTEKVISKTKTTLIELNQKNKWHI